MINKGIDGEIAVAVMKKLEHQNLVVKAYTESASGYDWEAVATVLNFNCLDCFDVVLQAM
jgi:hypothetical protein